LFDGHSVAAAGRDVDDDVRTLLDLGQELSEHVGIGRRAPGLRIAGVEVHDRRPRLRRSDSAFRDLGWSDRQVRGLRRDVNGARHGTADDHLAPLRHHTPRYSAWMSGAFDSSSGAPSKTIVPLFMT